MSKPRSQKLVDLVRGFRAQPIPKITQQTEGRDYLTDGVELDRWIQLLEQDGFSLELGKFTRGNPCCTHENTYKIYEDQVKLVGLMYVASSLLHIRPYDLPSYSEAEIDAGL
jgi:hypothetical protein